MPVIRHPNVAPTDNSVRCRRFMHPAHRHRVSRRRWTASQCPIDQYLPGFPEVDPGSSLRYLSVGQRLSTKDEASGKPTGVPDVRPFKSLDQLWVIAILFGCSGL